MIKLKTPNARQKNKISVSVHQPLSQ